MKRKRCSRCRRLRSSTKYTTNRSKPDGLNHSCIDCHRAYTRKHYQANKAYYFEKSKKHNRKVKAIVHELKRGPCSDCRKRFHPWQMDFDHARGKKAFTIAVACRQGWSLPRIRAELAKCDLVCANCHRHRTHLRRNSP